MKINQLKAGAILSYCVLGLKTIVGLAFTPYMLHMLGQSEYGLYSLVISTIGYLTILDLGFGNAIIRYTAKFKAEGKINEQYSMFGMFSILYTIIGIAAFLIGLILYFNVSSLFKNTMTFDELKKAQVMVLIMVFNLAITFPLSIFGSIITAYENFIFQKVIQIVRIILSTLIMVLILEMGYRSVAMIITVTFFNIATLLINYGYCKYKLKIKIIFRNFKWKFLKEVSTYSFYIFLEIIMTQVYWNTGQFVLGAFVGTTAIAVFAVAIQLQKLYMNFSTAITGLFLPKVTTMTTLKNSEENISELFIKTGRIQFIIMFFILSSFILFGKQFIILWAGSEYIQAYSISLLFFIPLTVPLTQNLGIIILQARNQMRFRSILFVVLSVLSLGLQIILAKKFGAIGCAVGISIVLIIGQIIAMNIYYHFKQKLNIIKFWKQIGKMFLPPSIIGSIFYYLNTKYIPNTITKLSIGILFFSILYILSVWFFSMNNYERDQILIPIKNLLRKDKVKDETICY